MKPKGKPISSKFMGGYTRSVNRTTDPGNYRKGSIGAKRLYGDGTANIPKQKVIVKTTPKKVITKTTDYGPVNYYGTQTRTRTKTVTKK